MALSGCQRGDGNTNGRFSDPIYIVMIFIMMMSAQRDFNTQNPNVWPTRKKTQHLQHRECAIHILSKFFFWQKVAPCWTGEHKSGRNSKQRDLKVTISCFEWQNKAKNKERSYDSVFVCQREKPKCCLSSDEDMHSLSYFTTCIQPC